MLIDDEDIWENLVKRGMRMARSYFLEAVLLHYPTLSKLEGPQGQMKRRRPLITWRESSATGGARYLFSRSFNHLARGDYRSRH